jgi:hypothetical protein
LARGAHCSAERNCLPLHFYGGRRRRGKREGIKVKKMKKKEKTNQIKITLK